MLSEYLIQQRRTHASEAASTSRSGSTTSAKKGRGRARSSAAATPATPSEPDTEEDEVRLRALNLADFQAVLRTFHPSSHKANEYENKVRGVLRMRIVGGSGGLARQFADGVRLW